MTYIRSSDKCMARSFVLAKRKNQAPRLFAQSENHLRKPFRSSHRYYPNSLQIVLSVSFEADRMKQSKTIIFVYRNRFQKAFFCGNAKYRVSMICRNMSNISNASNITTRAFCVYLYVLLDYVCVYYCDITRISRIMYADFF